MNMKKEYSVLITILVSFTAVTAGAVFLLYSQGNRPGKDSLREASGSLERPRESKGDRVKGEYQIKFADKYGVVGDSRARVKVHEVSGVTAYTISVEGLVPPREGGVYTVWLQTDEGARAKLGELPVGRDGKGELSVQGARPEESWFILISYQDASMPGEEMILRGSFSTSLGGQNRER